MRRQACDTLAEKLAARGLEAVRVFDGRKGYTLRVGAVTVATKTKGEAMLRKGKKEKSP